MTTMQLSLQQFLLLKVENNNIAMKNILHNIMSTNKKELHSPTII